MDTLAQNRTQPSAARRALWRAMSAAAPDGAADDSPPSPPSGATGLALAGGDANVPARSPEDAADALSIKVSVRRDRSFASPAAGVPSPQRALPGRAKKPIMLAAGLAGLAVMALLAAAGCWTLTGGRTGEGRSASLQPDPATLERAADPHGTVQAGLPAAASGEASRTSAASGPPPPAEGPAVDLAATAPASPPALATVTPGALPATTPAATPRAEPSPELSGGDGKASVQLATVFTGKAVKYEWHRLQKLLPDLLGSRDLMVGKHRRNGHTRWLVRTGGFDNDARAAGFCHLVHARGFHCRVVAAK